MIGGVRTGVEGRVKVGQREGAGWKAANLIV